MATIYDRSRRDGTDMPYDTGSRRHMILTSGAISFSAVGMLAEAMAHSQPDLVGIAALVSSVGGLILGTVAAVAAWRKKPDPNTVTLPVEIAEKLLETKRERPAE